MIGYGGVQLGHHCACETLFFCVFATEEQWCCNPIIALISKMAFELTSSLKWKSLSCNLWLRQAALWEMCFWAVAGLRMLSDPCWIAGSQQDALSKWQLNSRRPVCCRFCCDLCHHRTPWLGYWQHAEWTPKVTTINSQLKCQELKWLTIVMQRLCSVWHVCCMHALHGWKCVCRCRGNRTTRKGKQLICWGLCHLAAANVVFPTHHLFQFSNTHGRIVVPTNKSIALLIGATHVPAKSWLGIIGACKWINLLLQQSMAT